MSTIAASPVWNGRNPNSSGQRIEIRPPLTAHDNVGALTLTPNVAISNAQVASASTPWQAELQPQYQQEVIGGDLTPVAEPIFGEVIDESIALGCDHCPPGRLSWFERWFGCRPFRETGIGHERVVHAPFEITTTQPMNNFRMRLDAAYGIEAPDRAEFLWAKIMGARNPFAVRERETHYQDMRFMLEAGGEAFSTQIDIPIRMLDPELNGNTAGMGDMSVTTKTVLVDGRDRWQITQIFRTTFNTGSPMHRTGSGNIKLEPGVACRLRLQDSTYAHSEVTYIIPTAGDPLHQGQILRYGLGFSHVYYETDTTAILPTLEFVGWSVLGGLRTTPPGASPVVVDVDGEHILTIHPGVRFVADTGSDLGLWEFGVSGGVGVSDDKWYRGLLRADLRLSY